MVLTYHDVEAGPVRTAVDNAPITEFLQWLLNTNHWKGNPEVGHDKLLRLRKVLVETRKPASPKQAAA